MKTVFLVLAFASALAGFASLSLAMDRHHEDCHGRSRTPGLRKRRWLQAGGTLALGVSLWAAIAADGRTQGWVLWLGALTVSALATVLTLTYAPRTLVRVLAVAAALSLAGAMAGAMADAMAGAVTGAVAGAVADAEGHCHGRGDARCHGRDVRRGEALTPPR